MGLFQPAQRKKLKLRMCIEGPSGSGKTYTALRFAHAMGGKIAVIDTEASSACKYEGLEVDGKRWTFDVVCLSHYAPSGYVSMIKEAQRSGYATLIIDSLSHAWMGEGGALDQVDQKSGGTLGSFGAWRDVSPQLNALVTAVLHSGMNVIATMRTKMSYEVTKDEKGKAHIEKIGTKPLQRDGWEYEFDIVATMNLAHLFKVSKTRCQDVDGLIAACPTGMLMDPIMRWLNTGEAVHDPVAVQQDYVEINAGIALAEKVMGITTDPHTNLVNECKELFAICGIPKDKAQESIRKRGGGRLIELTQAALEELKAKLEVIQSKLQLPF